MVNNYNYGTTVLEDILKHIGINLQGADYLISKTQDTSVMKHYWGNFWPPRVMLSTDVAKSLQMASRFWYKSTAPVWKFQTLPHWHLSPSGKHLLTRPRGGALPARALQFRTLLHWAHWTVFSESWTFCRSVWPKSHLQLYTWLNNH